MRGKQHDIKHNGLVKKRDMLKEVMERRASCEGMEEMRADRKAEVTVRRQQGILAVEPPRTEHSLESYEKSRLCRVSGQSDCKMK
jgi:hypothetical protein